MIKRTVFNDFHRQLEGKLVPFAGYEMPVEFSGVSTEHVHVRTRAGVFDVSHMGEIWISGTGSASFVQKLTTNDVRKLTDGKVQYSALTNEQGGIIDDLLVYRFSEDRYLLVVNAANTEKDWDWISSHRPADADIKNASGDYAQLAIQGPLATKILQTLTDEDLGAIPYYHFKVGTFAGKADTIISNTGYTGAGGFELYMKNEDGPAILEKIMKEGGEDIIPVGLAARDTLRLEMGFCLHGNDIDESTTPLEAGLGWITRLVEGNEFTGSNILKKQKEEGLKRKLTGFVMQQRAIPRKDYDIYDENDQLIGKVTSGTMSPMTGKGIGMGYIQLPKSTPGSEIFIQIRNKRIPAMTVKPPFYKPDEH